MARFITCVGQDASDVYSGPTFKTEEGSTDMNTILTMMEKNYISKTNVIYERYVFNNHMQETHETVDAYATALRSLAKSCDFGSLKDDLIHDRIVCDIRDNVMRKRLLQESSLTLNKCMDICRAVESTDAKMKAMSGEKVHAFSQATDKKIVRKDNWHMNASSADTSIRDCVRNAQHGVKSVSCANQRLCQQVQKITERASTT